MTFQATVLYIEDDEASRVLVERVLTYAGYRCSPAGRWMESTGPRTTPIILTDINLPDPGARIAVRLLDSCQDCASWR